MIWIVDVYIVFMVEVFFKKKVICESLNGFKRIKL